MKEESLIPEGLTVTIGKQVWMTQNLNVDKFRNGDPIPEVKTNSEWQKAGINRKPAWCYYDNDPENGARYCKLYNWYAVNDPRGLAPEGWKVPSNDDWLCLLNFLFDECRLADESLDNEDVKDLIGEKMKSTEYWDLNRDGEFGNGNNESGFTGLPAGCRFMYDDMKNLEEKSFHWIGNTGGWWSSTESSETWAHYLHLNIHNPVNIPDKFKAMGFSVRCLKE